MTAELPAALAAALDRALEGRPRRDLAERAARTSAAYRTGAGSAGVIRGPDDALAYALTRLPATYAACEAVFREVRRLAPGFAPARLLDAGAGPGAASWAALETWPGLTEVAWLDASAPFLDLAADLAANGPAALRAARPMRGDLARGEAWPSADLVVASYALAELPSAVQGAVVRRLWDGCAGVLALVEPGTPAGFERLRAARELLAAEGADIVAPCPHARACPIAPPDWCHFSVRLPRRRDHRVAKGAAAPFEDEKFAYVAAARPGVASGRRTPRVLARPRAGKTGIELKLCAEDGLERRLVGRRDKAAHAQARRLGWGDALP